MPLNVPAVTSDIRLYFAQNLDSVASMLSMAAQALLISRLDRPPLTSLQLGTCQLQPLDFTSSLFLTTDNHQLPS